MEVTLDYFQIMELSSTASQLDIKNAYRRLASKYHPDRNQASDANEKFQKIQEAYSVLSNPAKKKQYMEAEYTTVIDPRTFVESFWNQTLNTSE